MIEAYSRYGLIVDVTHCGGRMSIKACEHSSQPVISSYSGAYAVTPYFRNISDDRLRAIAKTGGESCIVTCGYILDLSNPAFATTDLLFRHIDHMVQLIGVETR